MDFIFIGWALPDRILVRGMGKVVTRKRHDESLDAERVLRRIAQGDSAYAQLLERLPGVEARFYRANRTLVKILAEVQEHFPEAEYYTAGGGFNLLLGCAHEEDAFGPGRPRPELSALTGSIVLSDGDY